jgi:TonB-linked SusC/RagA family outer membrane protein
MKKVLLALSFVMVFGLSAIVAQTRTITGTVTGSDDGLPIPGASVFVKGTTVGTVTQIDGDYTLSVPQDAETLVISFVGMVAQEQVIAGRTVINVSLQTDAIAMDEVVVTAIGISRSEKSLGYSVGVVGSEDIEKAREGNVINSLSGRVAGLNIIQSSGTAGGGSKVVIRGQSSLGSSGEPLFIVDGMPISNSSLNFGINGAVDTGSRIGDLSSDDIATMSVLKGAAATALYGARAKDGAVVITTKKGSKNSPATVTVNSSLRFENPLRLPDFQNEFGPGVGATGVYSMNSWNGWGPNLQSVADQEFPIFTGEEVNLSAYKDNVKNFFETGKTLSNSVSIAGGDDISDYRLGLAALNQTGIIPNNSYDRYNVTFNGGREFSEKFSSRISFSYVNVESEGRAAQGSNDPNAIISTIYSMPRTMDVDRLKENWILDGGPYPLGSGGVASTNNPYWILNKNVFTNKVDRVFGNVVLTYKPFEGLTVTNNTGIDFFFDDTRRVWAKNTLGENKGRFITYNRDNKVLNNDLLITYDYDINEDFSLKLLAGHNVVQSTYEMVQVDAKDLLVADIYSYANAQTNSPSNIYRQRRLVGVFGDIGVSFRNMAFFNVTGRNDWSSTMPLSERSYFYPSFSGSFVFTEIIPTNPVLTFGKVRANYAIVGSDTDPYQLDYVYTPVNSYFLQYLGSTAGRFPHGGLLGYTSPRVFPDPNLKPQKQSGFEVGLDLRFFNGRINLDATYYSNSTVNHIAEIDAPNSTGYFNFRKNSGEISNKGVEIMLGLVPVKTGSFNWDINFNFASNQQKVVELDPSITELNLTSGYSGLQVKAAVGEPFSLYGIGWERDPEGNIVIDGTTGFRKTQSTGINLGKITPDFTLGITNSFTYKGINLSGVIDIRQGGVMYSNTVSSLRTSGTAEETLLNDRNPIVDKGVVSDGNGGFVPNTVEISAYDYWTQNYKTSNTEANVFGASYVKLREITLSYDLPRTWFDQMFLNSLSVGFEARNLWIISSDIPHIDPEVNFFSPGDVGSGVEFGSIPSTRSYGFNLKFSF